MIIVFHNQNRVTQIRGDSKDNYEIYKQNNVVLSLFELALKHPNSILTWCHESLKEYLNLDGVKASCYLKNIMVSYGSSSFFSDRIGYIEDSPFIKVNKKVKYPTWLMSSQVGAICASQLSKFRDKIKLNDTFDFVLNSIAKHGMPNGLFCYSDPKLLNSDLPQINYIEKASNMQLFKFVKLHYKSVWSSLLLLNVIINEGKIPLWAYLKSLFNKQQKFSFKFDLESLEEFGNKEISTLDIIIPTIGRKKYLHDVLKDLSNQTLLPKQVIIIEQNEDVNSKSELDFIKTQKWPFAVYHKFIHKTGACNARNLALKAVSSDYVFFADDDIRFKSDLLHNSIEFMNKNSLEAITLSCLRKEEVESFINIFQWNSFGSGCSIVKSNALVNTSFNLAFEHGFGEDADFGMQLRNLGTDILYYPNEKIIHLKAPVGGFRVEHEKLWENEREIKPKPSPTVMLNRLNNTTAKQLLGYRTKLFFKYYKVQKNKNPIAYYRMFKKQWKHSIYWANKLKA